MRRSLAAAIGSLVSPRSRARGESYFRGGRVTTTRADSTVYLAIVRGSEPYNVALRIAGDTLLVDCTCPYFEGNLEPCKHVWAAILAADEAATLDVPDRVLLDLYDNPVEDVDLDVYRAATPAPPPRPVVKRSSPSPPPSWRSFLDTVTPPTTMLAPARALYAGELMYLLDREQSASAGGLLIQLMTRDRKKSGAWGKPKPLSLARRDIGRLADDRDRRILEIVCGAEPAYRHPDYVFDRYGDALPVPSTFVLNATLQRTLAPRLCETGRFRVRAGGTDTADAELVEIEWDPEPAGFQLRIAGSAETGYAIDGALVSGAVERPFRDAAFITGALVLWRPAEPDAKPRLAALDVGGADRWMLALVNRGPVTVPAAEAPALIEAIVTTGAPRVVCPDELRVEVLPGTPQPAVRITRPRTGYGSGYYGPADRLEAHLSFAYGNCEADAWSTQPVVFDRERRQAWRRDPEAERAAIARLLSLGVRRVADWQTGGTILDLAGTVMPTVVRVLLSEGWRVEAEGRVYRRPGAVTLDVRTGIDWFELHGGVEFDGIRAELPALLAAVRRGDRFVRLGDGTFGLLPEDWIAGAGRIAAIGTPEADHVRFAPAQAALLDAWLATVPEVPADEAFARARAELARFDGVRPIDGPPTFHGELRDYQRAALGWFEFLRRFGFGGCLADEMGLGKTVMVLAALDARRLERDDAGRPPHPSLIVVPRSLVFNWHQEAVRFAPALRVLDLTGTQRRQAFDRIANHDVVLATYGTLRRDIGHLKEIGFDYVVLDEAQAIKNAATAASKAARLLKAEHRLALSGTPVENHLGELWSLFEFLNPGLLGAASVFAGGKASGLTADDDTLSMIAKGVRPFILRRTKDQVAAELPERTEQTLYCDLEPPQRALYDELRDHYRASLLGKVERVGLGRSKLQILEALLRLRQAACHPGLIDPERAGDAAAKLDVLLPRLQELVEDGRKVLVFSQFTKLLGLLRRRLDESRLTYEYLDGATRDRQARVERFQNGGPPLFLVSLKAGGLGLNLTAAEYVFLLDPWWNPAVEAQAIDRAHRIGQTRPVFAFRLIARDTVEEKVLELQATKRRLADAIVRADESLIRDLRREDLELLLS